MAERIVIIDILKAFTIILVVLGHCIQYGSGFNYLNNELYFENWLFKIIYSFHMPLFMIISGYLFAHTFNGNGIFTVYKKIKSLVVPMFIWSILLIVKTFILSNSIDFSPLNLLSDYLKSSLLRFWFIWAVFWCSCIVILVHKLANDSLIVYFFLFIITFVIPDAANMALYKYMYPYFVLGYLYKKYYADRLKIIYNNSYVIIGLFTLYAVLLYFFNYDTYIYTTGHSILGKNVLCQLRIDFHRYFIGITGSVIMIMLFMKLDGFIKSYKLLTKIGTETMGIYIISTFLNTNLIIPLTFQRLGLNYIVTILQAISVIFLSLLIIKFINKDRLLRKLMLGKN